MKKLPKVITAIALAITIVVGTGYIGQSAVEAKKYNGNMYKKLSKAESLAALQKIYIKGKESGHINEKETLFYLRGGGSDKGLNGVLGYSDIQWTSSASCLKLSKSMTTTEQYYLEELKYLMPRDWYMSGIVKKAGTTVIRCKITDQYGQSVTLTKTYTVGKGTPIKSMKFCKFKMTKKERRGNYAFRYTNKPQKKKKLSVVLNKGWSIKKVTYNKKSGGKYYSTKNHAKLTMGKKDDMKIKFVFVQKNTGITYPYQLDMVRYSRRVWNWKNVKAKNVRIKENVTAGTAPSVYVYSYKKNASKNSRDYFKSPKDLVRKLILNHEMSKRSVYVKGNKIVFRNRGEKREYYISDRRSYSYRVKSIRLYSKDKEIILN